MPKIIVKTTPDNSFTLVPNEFIDNFMQMANPSFSLIYIYLLRHKGEAPDTSAIADCFSMLESDVLKAFKHLDKSGLINYSECPDGGINIEFMAAANGGQAAGKAVSEAADQKSPKIDIAREIRMDDKPKYNPTELELYKNDYKEISDLFEFCEHTLGKPLSDSELSTLYSFYDWLMLPTDLIKYLLNYCAEKNHRRMKYIEAVAIDWAENNIKTVEAAQDYINIFNKDYREIMSAMGLSGRNPATKELEYMDKWYKEWEMPLPLILESCAKTVIAVGKAQFGYADKILESWHNAGARTLDDIKTLEQDRAEKTAQTEAPAQKKEMPTRKNRFSNYEQHVRNYDEIDRLEFERIKNKLKE